MEVGTKLKYIGPKEGRDCADLTVGRVYTIVGIDSGKEPYFVDDVGDPDWAAVPGTGSGIFEVVPQDEEVV